MCGFDEGGKGKWGGENVEYRSVCVALIASQGVGGASGTYVWTCVACGFNFERAGFLYSFFDSAFDTLEGCSTTGVDTIVFTFGSAARLSKWVG